MEGRLELSPTKSRSTRCSLGVRCQAEPRPYLFQTPGALQDHFFQQRWLSLVQGLQHIWPQRAKAPLQDQLSHTTRLFRPPFDLAFGFAFGLAFLAFWCRRHRLSVWRVTDAMTPAILVAIMLVRWGNFMNGELFGDPTTLPWGIVLPGIAGGPRHPLPLFEIVGTGLILLWVLHAAGRRRYDGYLFWSALVASSVLRFLLDLLRSEDRTALFVTWGQIAALVLIVWGIWFLWVHGREARMRQTERRVANI